ncbi:hypothetical protein GJ496_011597 [Pomphorhynchus laevis]|nr:hypothetical protein GJ496_011597 [Pomphorhynchus laevis]
MKILKLHITTILCLLLSNANATNAHSDTELNNKDITGASTSVNTEPSHVLEPTQADPDQANATTAHPDTELNNKDITGGSWFNFYNPFYEIANYALSLLTPAESSSSNHSRNC